MRRRAGKRVVVLCGHHMARGRCEEVYENKIKDLPKGVAG